MDLDSVPGFNVKYQKISGEHKIIMKFVATISGLSACGFGTGIMFPFILQHYFLGLPNNTLILLVTLLFMFSLSLTTSYILGKLK